MINKGFITAKATYGVDNCDVNWNEQAAKSAKQHLNYSSYSKCRVIELLEFCCCIKWRNRSMKKISRINSLKMKKLILIMSIFACVIAIGIESSIASEAFDISVFETDDFILDIDEMDDDGYINTFPTSVLLVAPDDLTGGIEAIARICSKNNQFSMHLDFSSGIKELDEIDTIIIKTTSARYTFTNLKPYSAFNINHFDLVFAKEDALNLLLDLSDGSEAKIRFKNENNNYDGYITAYNPAMLRTLYDGYIQAGGINQPFFASEEVQKMYPCTIKRDVEPQESLDNTGLAALPTDTEVDGGIIILQDYSTIKIDESEIQLIDGTIPEEQSLDTAIFKVMRDKAVVIKYNEADLEMLTSYNNSLIAYYASMFGVDASTYASMMNYNSVEDYSISEACRTLFQTMICDQVAKDQGITITNDEIDAVLSEYMIEENYEGTLDEFKEESGEAFYFLVCETEVLMPKVMAYLRGIVTIINSNEQVENDYQTQDESLLQTIESETKLNDNEISDREKETSAISEQEDSSTPPTQLPDVMTSKDLADIFEELKKIESQNTLDDEVITETAAVSLGEQNALSSAKSYLKYSNFSYSGLISQLKYEGYTDTEATYAVDNCGADWFKQALGSAKTYLKYSHFSYSGLIDQLEYEGFSNEEAIYAVDNCGADWFEQAVGSAASYLKYSSFSKDGLINQLEYEGFTYEQAVYGVEQNGY